MSSSATRKFLTVGVLGGMGPDATVDFMARVLAATPASVDEDHIRMIVDHNPQVPSRQAAILGDGEDPGAVMAGMARGLEVAGADFIVMPCNTAHVFQDSICSAISIPLVSIVDLTVAECRPFTRVGLMATAACLRAEIYQAALAAEGKDVVLPTDEELAEFTRLIGVIKTGEQGQAVQDGMRALANAMQQRGAQAIIAGCTEIPLVLDETMLEIPLISSTDILADATVAIAYGERQLPS